MPFSATFNKEKLEVESQRKNNVGNQRQNEGMVKIRSKIRQISPHYSNERLNLYVHKFTCMSTAVYREIALMTSLIGTLLAAENPRRARIMFTVDVT